MIHNKFKTAQSVKQLTTGQMTEDQLPAWEKIFFAVTCITSVGIGSAFPRGKVSGM